MMHGREHGAEQDDKQNDGEHQACGRWREGNAERGRGGKKQHRQRRKDPRRSRHWAVCAHITTPSRPGNGTCATQPEPSPVRAANELPGYLNSTKCTEIVVAALGKSNRFGACASANTRSPRAI